MDIIRKSQGNIYSAPLCEGSLVHRELIGDHYIQLVFKTAEAEHFRLGDYCETDFGRFELTDLYEPEANTDEGNLFGKGFELVSQTNALGDTRTRLEVDELFVRIKAFFASLEIREMSYVGGNYVFSAAGSKIYYVEWLDANGNIVSKTGGAISSVYKFRCYLYSDNGTTATINKWAVDDQVMCRVFNIDTGTHQNVSNKYYWRSQQA